MKFSLFVHMERADTTFSHAQALADLTELTLMAESAGFEAVWIGEHHAMEFTIAPNPFVQLAYLAPKTERIRLGTGTLIAPFWHPIKLAGEAAMADVICGGRLDIGLARGAYQFEYERLMPGLDAWGAGLRLREMVPAIKGLWRGDYAHDGEFWKFPATTAVPSPVQQPHPPLWIAARDPNSHDFAVANGCHVQVTPLASGDAEVANLMQKFQTAVAAHPEVPRPQIMLLMHCFTTQDEAEAQFVARALSGFYCAFAAWFKNERPVSKGFIAPLSEAEMAAMPQYAPDLLRKNLVIGTPEEVTERLKGYEALGYDQFSIWIDSLMPHEMKKKTLRRFIDHVMPAFG